MAYQSAGQYQTSLSSVLHDPRLPMALEAAEHSAGLWSKQTNDKQMQLAIGMKDGNGEQQLAKLKALRSNTVRLYSDDQAQKLIKTAAELKTMVGSKTDFDFSQVASGIAAAQTPQQRINVISYFSKAIKSKLLPLLSTQGSSAGSAPESDPDPPTPAATAPQSSPTQGQPAEINGNSAPQRDQRGNTV